MRFVIYGDPNPVDRKILFFNLIIQLTFDADGFNLFMEIFHIIVDQID